MCMKKVYCDCIKEFEHIVNKIDGILKHYKYLFESRSFDEFDVMGFLIFVRNDDLQSKYPILYDFANIVAHRERTTGIAYNNMAKAIENAFELNSKGKVKGFCGPSYNSVINEIKGLMQKYDINIDKTTVIEIIFCLISIGQDVECKNNDQYLCTLKVFHDSEMRLSLVAVGIKASVCYFKCEKKYALQEHYSAGYINQAFQFVRIDGILQMRSCENGCRM